MDNDKIKVYFTFDTENIELIKDFIKVLDFTGIFEINLSQNQPLQSKELLDSRKIDGIVNCDVMIILLTRRSQRFSLVKGEARLANVNQKIIFPLLEQRSSIPRAMEVTGQSTSISFDKNNRKSLVSSAKKIISQLAFQQVRLKLSNETIERGLLAVSKLEKESYRELFPSESEDSIQEIVSDIFSYLNYRVEVPFRGSSKTSFDMFAKKGKRRIGIDCFIGKINASDVIQTSKYSGVARERLIVCSNTDEEASEIAKKELIDCILTSDLIKLVHAPIQNEFLKRYASLEKFEQRQLAEQENYATLKGMLQKVTSSKTSFEKGNSLELFAEFLIKLIRGLDVIKKNVRIENEELDLVVKNENEGAFWQRLGTPIIIECKNWSAPVGAPEVRDLIMKMREVKTAFLFAVNGITEKKGAQYEILEARKNGKFILVFELVDFQHIIKGANIDTVVQDLFYSLWTKLIFSGTNN